MSQRLTIKYLNLGSSSLYIDEMIEVLGYSNERRPRLEDIFEVIYGKLAIEEPKVYANFLLCLMGKL